MGGSVPVNERPASSRIIEHTSGTDWIKLHVFVAPALERAVLAGKVSSVRLGILLAQNDGPYRPTWVNGHFYIQMHVNFTVLKGHFKF